MESSSKESKAVMGEATSETLRKFFVPLLSAVMMDDVPLTLYSNGLIDQRVLEFYTNLAHNPSQKGTRIVMHLQNVLRVKPSLFEIFCNILSENSEITSDLAKELKAEFSQQVTQLKSSANSGDNVELEKLKKKLEVYMDDRSKTDQTKSAANELIKSALKQYIESLVQSDMPNEKLKEHMQMLCQEEAGLIPADLHKWIFEQIDSLHLSSKLQRTLTLKSSSPSSPAQKRKPVKLFSKDTVYHAGLCCHAVTTCTSITIVKFLSIHTNSFMESSLSLEDTGMDQYLIAKQGDTLYVAFQSLMSINLWIQKYKSFAAGIEQQTNRVPIRFFIEQLQLGKKIVITGFSFGGTMACNVIAKLWRETYANVSLDILKENVVCICFGLPLIQILQVQEAIKDFPNIEETIHSIYCKDDVIPGLLHYFRQGCMHYTTMKSLGSVAATVKSSTKQNGSNENLGAQVDFKTQFSELFLPCMATLQEAASKKPSYSGAVSSCVSPQSESQAAKDLKDTLHQLTNNGSIDFKPTNILLPGTCYVMSTEDRKGLVWSELPKSAVASILYVDKAAIEKLDSSIFKKHNMEQYRNKMFRCYLEKEPLKFTIPKESQSTSMKAVQFLNPEVKGVECHMYPKENVLVLEGNNLWFCYMVCVGEESENVKRISTPAQSISRKSIQVNYKQTSQDTREYGSSCENIMVTLHSHFSEPLKKMVTIKQNRYSFSVRQIQLAKHTPTQVIELAYWTAMLERKCIKSDQKPSKRFTAIIHFLQEAVNIVPLESILHAIAYSDDNTALECARALKESKVKVPNSVMAGSALVDACIHLSLGIRLTHLNKEALTLFRKSFMFKRMLRKELSQLSTSIMDPPEPNVPPRYSDIVRGSQNEEEIAFLHSIAPLWPLIIPMFALSETLESISADPLDSDLADFMEEILDEKFVETVSQAQRHQQLPVISKKFIKQLYPVSPLRHTMHIPVLQSPVKVLNEAIDQLKTLEKIQDNESESDSAPNEKMLVVVKDIHKSNLQVCTALLAAFMEQQIHIPLLSSPEVMASNILSASSAPVAMGVWALFSMSLDDLQLMLASTRGNALYVEIEAYIAGVLDPDNQDEQESTEVQKNPEEENYAGKLQFLLQGIEQTATCSTEYISYSLEYQLCKHLKFDQTLSVNEIMLRWNSIFKNDALSLVAPSYRPLIARWLKWVLLVHDLRETLASYTCVGVIGLVNSGKSQLVSTLFNSKVMVGTTKSTRTTVPFIYNYDGAVEGFDVIDFPGVDDEDAVPELAKLLVSLCQAVVFVVDYRKINTEPAQAWLRCLTKEGGHIPVFICLTFADRLLVECLEKTESKRLCYQHVDKEFEHIKEKLRFPVDLYPKISVRLCCFKIASDSNLKPEDLQAAKISQTHDVGQWLVELFRSNEQEDLADNLEHFLKVH